MQNIIIPPADEAGVYSADDLKVVGSTPKSRPKDLPEGPSCDQTAQEPQSDSAGAGGADSAAASAISLSKTPIMRMKTKSEPKRIAVSLKSSDEGAGEGAGGGGGGDGELGGEQEPIEAPLGPMTPVEKLLHDSMKFGGGGLLVSPQSEQLRKSSILNPTILPAGLAQVEKTSKIYCFFI